MIFSGVMADDVGETTEGEEECSSTGGSGGTAVNVIITDSDDELPTFSQSSPESAEDLQVGLPQKNCIVTYHVR